MTTLQPRTANQPPPLEGYDLYGENRPLVEAVAREGADWADTALRELGTLLGGEPLELGRLANEHPPRLRTHDRFGNRIDEVEFHPAWHELLGLAVSCGLHASPWREPRPGAHVARAAAFITLAEVEAGVGCPLSMTFAAVPALRAEPALVDEWAPLLTSTVYDPGLRPAADKAGALCGMAMTERQGGSDVRANETVARPVGDGEATLHGHKWFCSAPMCDAFLVLAQAPGGSDVLPAAARAAGRRAQRVPHRPAEGQARQPLERVGGDPARGRVGAARRRGGSRRRDDHRDGRAHAARLRARLDRAHAARGRARRRITQRTVRPSGARSSSSR